MRHFDTRLAIEHGTIMKHGVDIIREATIQTFQSAMLTAPVGIDTLEAGRERDEVLASRTNGANLFWRLTLIHGHKTSHAIGRNWHFHDGIGLADARERSAFRIGFKHHRNWPPRGIIAGQTRNGTYYGIFFTDSIDDTNVYLFQTIKSPYAKEHYTRRDQDEPPPFCQEFSHPTIIIPHY